MIKIELEKNSYQQEVTTSATSKQIQLRSTIRWQT